MLRESKYIKVSEEAWTKPLYKVRLKLISMNKIIKAALTAKFQGADIDAILSVINATPNPEMAIEILLGVYDPPLIPFHVQDGKSIRTYIKEDEWKKEIVYSYEASKTISGYFPKGTKREDVTIENFKLLQIKGKRGICFSIPTGEMETKESTCSFEQWLSYKPVLKEEEDTF